MGEQGGVPKSVQGEVLNEGHPGVARMKRLARMFVWWPKLDEEIERRVKSCHECQSNRVDLPSAPLQPWKWPAGHGLAYISMLLAHLWGTPS